MLPNTLVSNESLKHACILSVGQFLSNTSHDFDDIFLTQHKQLWILSLEPVEVGDQPSCTNIQGSHQVQLLSKCRSVNQANSRL